MGAQPVIQHSFHTGEWAPALNARVDLAKYHSAAALLRNFFVDYRGGASSRMGTKYILQAFKSTTVVRLIPFQASFTVGYVLEFGDLYIRFYSNGSPILESTKTITGITKANPAVVTSAAHGYNNGDWVYILSVVGMTQVNGNYYIVAGKTTNTFQLNDLNGNAIDSTGYTAYISGGTAQRVYTIVSPYAAADLALVKFSQNVNTLILTHPNYPPQVLTLNSAASWSIAAITFASSQAAPTGVAAATTLGAGSVNYAYCVTAVDANGQESAASAIVVLASKLDLRTTLGSNRITWTAASGATSYNVYKAELVYTNAVPAGAQLGYIGNCTGVAFDDSNIDQDFSLTPPIAENPFSGSGISSITITNPGPGQTAVPNITIAPPVSGTTAQAQVYMITTGVTVAYGGQSGNGYVVEDTITLTNGVILTVTSEIFGVVTGVALLSVGPASTVISSNPLRVSSTSGGGKVSGNAPTFNLTYSVAFAVITVPGTGYGGAPAITFSSGGAAATAVLGASSAGNPAVPAFFQQRLVLAAPPGAVQTFYMSQTGAYYNYNVSNPAQDDDAITASLVSGQLNEIKSMISMPSGLIILSSKAAWQINGGSAGSAVTPSAIVASANAYNGASDVPPIIANFDILYVQSKGSIVRDLTYNFYANIFTGTDISVLSSHLFFGYSIIQWAWAEEPFKLVWAVRNDGTLLSLTFLKEQELIGWTHHDTNGLFNSVATITETIQQGSVDAVYLVVQRTVNGNSVQYIERMADRFFSNAGQAWCVDAGLQYSGAAATNFSGAQHLAGMTVTGLADGVVIPPFTMPVNGNFTLPSASLVTVGLAFTPQLQTLAIDLGEPTIQGKRKKITAVTVRCEDTLGLSIGSTFDSTILVPMKDLVVGNVGSQTNEIVTGLVTGDARTILDPEYTEPGQYCIQQSYPLPATILGVIPEIVVGDTK